LINISFSLNKAISLNRKAIDEMLKSQSIFIDLNIIFRLEYSKGTTLIAVNQKLIAIICSKVMRAN
jgi:hypothetical protein